MPAEDPKIRFTKFSEIGPEGDPIYSAVFQNVSKEIHDSLKEIGEVYGLNLEDVLERGIDGFRSTIASLGGSDENVQTWFDEMLQKHGVSYEDSQKILRTTAILLLSTQSMKKGDDPIN